VIIERLPTRGVLVVGQENKFYYKDYEKILEDGEWGESPWLRRFLAELGSKQLYLKLLVGRKHGTKALRSAQKPGAFAVYAQQ